MTDESPSLWERLRNMHQFIRLSIDEDFAEDWRVAKWLVRDIHTNADNLRVDLEDEINAYIYQSILRQSPILLWMFGAPDPLSSEELEELDKWARWTEEQLDQHTNF